MARRARLRGESASRRAVLTPARAAAVPSSTTSASTSARRWTQMLAMFSDAARLRVLRALEANELAVGELARALQVPQSTASRLIKPLFERGFVTRRLEGTTSLYRADLTAVSKEMQSLWELSKHALTGSAQSAEDDARLAAVIADRPMDSLGYFGRVGGEWDAIRRELFGEAGGIDGLLALLDPDWVVADIGCGTGEVAQRLAPSVGRVVAIDREAAMIDAARRRLSKATNTEVRRGDILALPARDAEFDAAIAMLLFHHIEDPSRAMTEIARCVKVGGRILVIDMVEHERTSYRTSMGHRHLGFSQESAKVWARAAPVVLRRWRRITPVVDVRGPGLFCALFSRR